MIIIICEGKRLAKFEGWDGNKAMDWITQKGLYRKDRIFAYPDTIWMCDPLSKDEA